MPKINRTLLLAVVLLALLALAGVAFRVAFVSVLVGLAAAGAAASIAWWAWRSRIGSRSASRLERSKTERLGRRP